VNPRSDRERQRRCSAGGRSCAGRAGLLSTLDRV